MLRDIQALKKLKFGKKMKKEDNEIIVFKGKNIRRIWHKDKWFFSLHASGFISIEFERETVLGKGGYGTVFREEWNNKRVAGYCS